MLDIARTDYLCGGEVEETARLYSDFLFDVETY